MLQEWSKEDRMDEDPFLALLQEHPLYKEDPEGFWAMATFGYASSHRMGTYEYMKFFLSLASPYLDTWEIIDVLYRENPELTVERRDQICADFHIDKILIEALWCHLQRYHQRIIEKSFKENPELTMERLTKISACSSASLMQGSGYGIDKELIEGYWSVLQRRSKQNARADETI
ncbi:hypothetical protein Ddc_09684 [Ditylenchus destructor]|nr:hypothetical protein Ddc_09684 [Ditylenchus destructor]